VEGHGLHQRWPEGFIDWNIQIGRYTPHLTIQVRQQIVEMHEQDILQMPVVPPALRMRKMRKERVAIAFPGESASVEPGVEGCEHMRRGQGQGVADTARRSIDLVDACRTHVVPVMPQRHEHVEAVTTHEDVLDLVAEGEPIEW